MKNSFLIILLILFSFSSVKAQENPSWAKETKEEKAKRMAWWTHDRFGMFIHWGIYSMPARHEWVQLYEKISAADYQKYFDNFDPDLYEPKEWAAKAKAAGMKYVVITTKHHDGFCLWDSRATNYDVASSGNPTNVVKKVSEECERQGIGLGLYYSLWDVKQNDNVADSTLDKDYNKYILAQLSELVYIVQKHTQLVELWLDGCWMKPNYRWPLDEIYKMVKEKAPQCQIGVNWSIGLPEDPDKHYVLPSEQKEGYPIRYFPSDFRLGDPYLPSNPDPKLFTHNGKTYYMPWESTVCLSEKWFFNTEDSIFKSIDELAIYYTRATAQNNILILNTSPNREGRIRDREVQILMDLRDHLNL